MAADLGTRRLIPCVKRPPKRLVDLGAQGGARMPTHADASTLLPCINFALFGITICSPSA
jgi:hypothetical protein